MGQNVKHMLASAIIYDSRTSNAYVLSSISSSSSSSRLLYVPISRKMQINIIEIEAANWYVLDAFTERMGNNI